MNDTIRAALVNVIKANRMKMSRAQRSKGIKTQRWLYPLATETRYGSSYRAWVRPMITYVHNYIRENHEEILRGDSTDFRADSAEAVLARRLDAVPGKSFRVMIDSLNGWLAQYVPTDNEDVSGSPIYMGLGKIADSVFDFNEGQFEKGAKSTFGIEFPTGEDWWPDARENWQQFNYQTISGDMGKYVKDINRLVERAVTSGSTVKTLREQIMKLDKTISKSRADFIARDQIGKLNGQITQMRMESIGLTMYVWETAGDERVRSTHRPMDGKLCLWADSTVYSDDGGKTWIDRPMGAVELHPGEDYQCRCTATAYWQELVGEADAQIDLLSENENNIPNTGEEGLRVLSPRKPSLTPEQEQILENTRNNESAARSTFQNEQFVDASSFKIKQTGPDFEVPKNLENIKIAKSRITPTKGKNHISDNDAKTLAKELRQARVLTSRGSSVYLVPKIKDAQGRDVPGPDALVNGTLFEFKTITGGIDKVERRFRQSRDQGQNVFIRVMNSNISKNDVIRKMFNVINDTKYTGGFKGKMIFSVGEGSNEKVHYIKIKDLKK